MPVPDGAEILPSLNARVYVNLTQLAEIEPLIYIPESALFTPDEQSARDDTAYVWRVDPQTATVSRQRIELGPLTSYGVVVLAGLASGDQIVGAGVQLLREGAQVRPLTREPGLR